MGCCEKKLTRTCETLRYFKIFYGKNVDTILTVGKQQRKQRKSGIMIELPHKPKRIKQSSGEHEEYIRWDVPNKDSQKKSSEHLITA